MSGEQPPPPICQETRSREPMGCPAHPQAATQEQVIREKCTFLFPGLALVVRVSWLTVSDKKQDQDHTQHPITVPQSPHIIGVTHENSTAGKPSPQALVHRWAWRDRPMANLGWTPQPKHAAAEGLWDATLGGWAAKMPLHQAGLTHRPPEHPLEPTQARCP